MKHFIQILPWFAWPTVFLLGILVISILTGYLHRSIREIKHNIQVGEPFVFKIFEVLLTAAIALLFIGVVYTI